MTQLSLATPMQREEIYRLRWMKPMSIMSGESTLWSLLSEHPLRFLCASRCLREKTLR